MKKGTMSRFALYSAGHLTASVFGWFWLIKALRVGVPSRLFEWIMVVILSPVAFPFARKGFGNHISVMIAVFVANSLLWGTALTWLVNRMLKTKATNQVSDATSGSAAEPSAHQD